MEARISRVMGFRNAAAHAGLVDPSGMGTDLAAILPAMDAILRDLGVDRDVYYSEYLGAVDAALDTSKRQVDAETAAAIASARLEFDRRYQLAPGYNAVEALNGIDSWERYEMQPYECPACHCTARLLGESDGEWAPETDPNGELTGMHSPSPSFPRASSAIYAPCA